jgi:hypothetical protein
MAVLKHKHTKHLDTKLKFRWYIYLIISVLLFLAVLYEIFTSRVSMTLAGGGLIIGLGIGVIAARMFLISWDKDAKKIISRLDLFGGVILAVYIVIAILRSKIIGEFVESDYVTGTSISVIAGIMIGRVFGTGHKITKILKEQKLL